MSCKLSTTDILQLRNQDRFGYKLNRKPGWALIRLWESSRGEAQLGRNWKLILEINTLRQLHGTFSWKRHTALPATGIHASPVCAFKQWGQRNVRQGVGKISKGVWAEVKYSRDRPDARQLGDAQDARKKIDVETSEPHEHGQKAPQLHVSTRDRHGDPPLEAQCSRLADAAN